MKVSSVPKSSCKHSLTILTFLILISNMINPISAASKTPDNTNTYFIMKSCNTTTYSSLCTKTLTPYASAVGTSPVKLCNAALTVAIQATTNCSTAVSKLSNQKTLTRPDARAIKDCIGDLKDAVYELKQTVNAMKHLGDSNREFEWANAKTYASAAITDAETCVDEKLVNGSAKKKIKSCVSGVEKLISNALALINHLY